MNPDPASLDNLRDIVLPERVPWWPPAPGWYVVAALLLLLSAWAGWRFYRHWRANAYRRAALRELKHLEHEAAETGVHAGDLAELLRRTALCVYPRDQVIGAVGPAWQEFLNTKISGCAPLNWSWLPQTYGRLRRLSPGCARAALRQTRYWLRHHCNGKGARPC